jgi:hypothetical protein
MRRLLGGFQQDFEKAKRQYPRAMQILVLAVKQSVQECRIPRTIPTADVIGLNRLGVLELEVGEKRARAWLAEEAIPLLRQTTLAELRGYVVEKERGSSSRRGKKPNPPVSGVHSKEMGDNDGEWGDSCEGHPVAAIPGIN